MKLAMRTQDDDLQDYYSDLAGIDMSDQTNKDNRDVARQEFKADADIQTILKRFGVMSPGREIVYGEADYTVDLQTAFDAMEEAKRAHARLSPELKERYSTWQALLNALHNGSLVINEEKPGEQINGSTPATTTA